MICANCGNWVEDGAQSCPGCGAPVMAQGAAPGAEMNMGQPGNGPVGGNSAFSGYTESKLDRKAFYKHPNVSSLSKQIKACGIAMYILAGFNFGLYMFLGEVVAAVIALVFMMGIGLGIHLGQSRVCAVILTVYGVYNMGVNYINSGRFAGWAFLLVGCYALAATFKFQKAWKQYKNTGIVPFVAGK